MKIKIILSITLGVLWTPNVIFSQYFNKISKVEDLSRSYIWQVFPEKNDIYCCIEQICENDNLCINFSKISKDGNLINNFQIEDIKGFFNRFLVKGDTVYFSNDFFSYLDSFTYWSFGMMKTNGELIVKYNYKILHLSETGTGSFGYNFPLNYGLTLVKNNEVILWGEGLDNRQPNPGKVPYRSVFLRVGLDGTKKGEPFWFDLSDFPMRRMSDACTDIDGNMVFHYEYGDNEIPKTARSIYKIMPDDSIKLVAEFPVTILAKSLPKIAIDNQGNYIINLISNEGFAPGYNNPMREIGLISKIDRSGKEVWQGMIPPYSYDWLKQTVATNTRDINRISTTKNGDVLCAGSAFVADSFDVPGQVKKLYSGDYVSFIARFSANGNLMWRHFIVPHKKNGKIRRNNLYDIQESEDGSIITAGQLERDDDDIDPRYITDAWLMRLSPDGCLTDDCSHIGKYFDFPAAIVSTLDVQPKSLIALFPNPGTDQLHIALPDEVILPLQYQIADLQGHILEQGAQSERKFTITSDFLSPGMYIVLVQDKSGKVWQGKWVKI